MSHFHKFISVTNIQNGLYIRDPILNIYSKNDTIVKKGPAKQGLKYLNL
ncbi:hypothetical protein PU02_0645 [Bartonella ancashensis]|uniref:Uncharacterized protein n=1 Tax=Bartonella ancashensis TaxID=1318743 RepID=A0A0M4LSM4_9HYPH|nr:hypothetical protein PU02_0645 [Bartonella ancashensis]